MATPTGEATSATISHPRFAAFYNWLGKRESSNRLVDPFRQQTAGQAHGVVLEIGAGTGLNFPFYRPEHVERVEATEPDPAMLNYTRERAAQAPVPITLTQAPAEALPFADATFDSAVIALVLCSVHDPAKSLQEIRRVLKPQGDLYLFEHVRSQKSSSARIQNIITPLTKRLFGNCHWNRNTEQTVRESGFSIVELTYRGARTIQPFLVLHANCSS